MKSNIKIYQNYITDTDIKELDPSFIPNDWRHNPTPELYETAIFFDFFDSGRYKEADYVGVVSKKFFRKTKLPGKDFIEFIRNNPGADVYFINPFPQNRYFSYNVWGHGELCHKGICDAAQYLFDTAKMPIRLEQLGRNNADNLLYCNYWVGSTSFWEKYIPFLRLFFNTIENEMPSDKRKIFFDNTTHDGGHTPLFTFIFERLFSTYLLLNPDTKSYAYKHQPEEIMSACIDNSERHVYRSFGALVDRLDAENNDQQTLYDVTNGLLSLLPKIRHE